MPILSLQFLALGIGLTAAAFLIGLLVSPKSDRSASGHLLLFLGIALLPGLALLLGADAAMEGAKRPQFCGSCHVMDPFMADMKNPGSPALAAVHHRNRFILENPCYTCHTGYTIFGPVKAKMAGLRHVWKYQTGWYTLPIRLRGTFDIGTCLHCHGESAIFLQKHDDDTRRMLDSREATCLDCHAPVHVVPEGGS